MSNDQKYIYRAERILAGFCRDCGAAPPLPDRVVCEPCMKARTFRGNRFKDKRNANQLCSRCGNDLELNRLSKKYCLKCSNAQTETCRQARKRNKEIVINYFGGKCLHCNISDIRVLTLDHVNGDGHLERKGKRTYAVAWYAKLYALIIKKKFDLLPTLQLLCYNCHAIKDLSPWWTK